MKRVQGAETSSSMENTIITNRHTIQYRENGSTEHDKIKLIMYELTVHEINNQNGNVTERTSTGSKI